MKVHRVLFLVAAPAFAQDVTVDMGGMGMPSMQMRVKTGQPQPAAEQPAAQPSPTKPPPGRVVGADTFAIDYSPLGGGANQIKVKSPEGAQAQVWNEQGELEGSFEVPFNFKGRGGTYYRFILTTPAGEVLFDRKLEVRQYLTGELRQKSVAAAPAPAPAPVAAPPPPAAPSGPLAMSPSDFGALLEAVKAESFSSNKLDTIETAAGAAWFTIDQVGQLVDQLDMSGDKVKVVELTRAHLVDKQNGFKLASHFTFSGDKEKVKALLK